MHFVYIALNMVNFDSNSIEVFVLAFRWKYVNVVLNNDRAPNRRQAIAWSTVDPDLEDAILLKWIRMNHYSFVIIFAAGFSCY